MSAPVSAEQPPLNHVESLEIEKTVTNNESAIEKKEVIPSTPAAVVENVPTTHYLSMSLVATVIVYYLARGCRY